MTKQRKNALLGFGVIIVIIAAIMLLADPSQLRLIRAAVDPQTNLGACYELEETCTHKSQKDCEAVEYEQALDPGGKPTVAGPNDDYWAGAKTLCAPGAKYVRASWRSVGEFSAVAKDCFERLGLQRTAACGADKKFVTLYPTKVVGSEYDKFFEQWNVICGQVGECVTKKADGLGTLDQPATEPASYYTSAPSPAPSITPTPWSSWF